MNTLHKQQVSYMHLLFRWLATFTFETEAKSAVIAKLAATGLKQKTTIACSVAMWYRLKSSLHAGSQKN